MLRFTPPQGHSITAASTTTTMARRPSKKHHHRLTMAAAIMAIGSKAAAFTALPPSRFTTTDTNRLDASRAGRSAVQDTERPERTRRVPSGQTNVVLTTETSTAASAKARNFNKKKSAIINDALVANERINNRDVMTSTARSQRRMIKANKLLEMAQVSPSQRLELMEEGAAIQRTRYSYNTTDTEHPSSNDRAPKISGGSPAKYAKSEIYQMRMADTFDSVDNLVDSKSLLPGGRWTAVAANDGDEPAVGVGNRVASFNDFAGQVAEVRNNNVCSSP